MATCSNCKKSLSCGCQKRKASNGREVCTNCIGAYERTTKTVFSATRIPSAPAQDKPKSTQPKGWDNWLKNFDTTK
jgi:hypothetical protein